MPDNSSLCMKCAATRIVPHISCNISFTLPVPEAVRLWRTPSHIFPIPLGPTLLKPVFSRQNDANLRILVVLFDETTNITHILLGAGIVRHLYLQSSPAEQAWSAEYTVCGCKPEPMIHHTTCTFAESYSERGGFYDELWESGTDWISSSAVQRNV